MSQYNDLVMTHFRCDIHLIQKKRKRFISSCNVMWYLQTLLLIGFWQHCEPLHNLVHPMFITS